MKKLTAFLISLLFVTSIYSQAPQGFNYQAIAHNNQGSLLQNQNLDVRITIYNDDNPLWSEDHTVTTNDMGLFTLIIGDPYVPGSGTAGSFDQIDWGSGLMAIGIEVDNGNGFVDLGKTPFQSVPYALFAAGGLAGGNQDSISTFNFVGIGTDNTSRTSLAVQGLNNEPEIPLFEVRREDGVPVFAVFNDGVMVYVDESRKGIKGGFAVGGYNSSTKGYTNDYLRVTPDSVRIYVPAQTEGKGVEGDRRLDGS